MADAGFKLAVEGEKEFKKALADINAQIKVNKSELKLLTAEYEINEDKLGNLQQKQGVLASAMEDQAKKVKIAEERYKAWADELGEGDGRVLKLKESLNLAQAELAQTTAEWQKNQKAIESFEESTEAAASAEEEMRKTFEDMEARLRANTSELKLLDARYADAQDSAEKLAEKNRVLSDSIETQKSKIASLRSALNEAEKEYGQQSKEVQAYREQLNNAEADLIDMTKQVERNNEELEKTGKTDLGGLTDALDGVLGKVGIEIPDGIKGMTSGFDGAALAVGGITTAAAGVLAKITEITKEAIDWADELTTKSQTIGIDTEKMQALEYAAGSLGVSVETIDDVIKEINNKAGETDKIVGQYVGNIEALQSASEEEKKAVAEATKEWEALGVQIYDENGNLRDAIDIFYDLVDAFGRTSNATERQKQMQDLLGESARRLNPLIEAGTEQMRRLEQEARDTGVVLGENLVRQADAAAAAMERMEMKIDSVKKKFALLVSGFGEGVWNTPIEGFFDIIGDIGGILFPKYATGTDYHPGGLAWVGEEGPELVNLPRGSQVIPNDRIGTGSVMNQTVNVYVDHIESMKEIERIAATQRTNIRMGYTKG